MTTMTQTGSLDTVSNSIKESGPDFSCLHCGTCCTRYRVRLSLGEARRICEGLGLCWYTFLGSYLEPISAGTDQYYLRQKDGACIFLKATDKPYRKVCLIQAWQPEACREWMPGLFRKECREGLQKYWRLTVTPEGNLQGNEEQINQLKAVQGKP